jgi:hypothetical protein
MFLSSGGLHSLFCDNLGGAGVAIPPPVLSQLFGR